MAATSGHASAKTSLIYRRDNEEKTGKLASLILSKATGLLICNLSFQNWLLGAKVIMPSFLQVKLRDGSTVPLDRLRPAGLVTFNSFPKDAETDSEDSGDDQDDSDTSGDGSDHDEDHYQENLRCSKKRHLRDVPVTHKSSSRQDRFRGPKRSLQDVPVTHKSSNHQDSLRGPKERSLQDDPAAYPTNRGAAQPTRARASKPSKVRARDHPKGKARTPCPSAAGGPPGYSTKRSGIIEGTQEDDINVSNDSYGDPTFDPTRAQFYP